MSAQTDELDRLVSAKILKFFKELDERSTVRIEVPPELHTAKDSYVTTGMCGIDTKPVTLQQLIAQHNESLAMLDDVVSALHEKLDAVCRPGGPQPIGTNTSEDLRPSESYLADRINMATNQARSIKSRLCNLLERIAL